MSEIKNSGLDQYGAESFEQQKFGTSGVEGVNSILHVLGSSDQVDILTSESEFDDYIAGGGWWDL